MTETTAMQNSWEALGISDDFLFGKVMSDPGLCQELLQLILPHLKIDRIEYPQLQKSIREDADARSIRLDVYVNDENHTVYDIEMQTTATTDLPKRSRYYQSMIDLQLLNKNQSYKRLNRSFVIFICLKDLFGKGRYIYTFENLCKEDNSLSLGDETTKIFLNASGTSGDISQELKAFLDYTSGKTSDDHFVKRLDAAVKEAKKNRKWRHEYMTLWMRDQENQEIGEERGIKKGIDLGINLGIEQTKLAWNLFSQGRSIPEIAKELSLPEATVTKMLK
ncbi:MAG: Rpn family recombination-promoting nuclease/putative transposase [Lachnospiraceae bacterium]